MTGEICILINSLTIGGAEKIALVLSREWRKKGVKTVFVCLEKNDFFAAEGEEVVYLSDHTGEGENFLTKLLFLFVFAWRLKKFLRNRHISFVQSHLYRANYVNVLARMSGSGHRAQVVNHGIVSRYKQDGLAGRVSLMLVRMLYGRADQVVLPSQGMRDDLRTVGRFANETRVINNPFDVEAIEALKDEALGADEVLFEEGTRCLVVAGRLEKVKRIDDIIHAVRILTAQGLKVRCLVLGEGPEKENLAALAGELGLRGIVFFPGSKANPFKYMARADVLVSASEFEGFGNVIVEAMICGTPVAATDCASGPREILAPQSKSGLKLEPGRVEFADYGVLVPVGDRESLAAALAKLLTDVAMLADYAAKGPVRARDFDKTVIAQRYLESMRKLMGE